MSLRLAPARLLASSIARRCYTTVADASAAARGGSLDQQSRQQQQQQQQQRVAFNKAAATHDTHGYYSRFHKERNFVQKGMLMVGGAVMGALDPLRGESVATLGETVPFTETILRNRILPRMQRSESGRRVLLEKPVVLENNTLPNDAELRALPENTLGHQYWRYMHTWGFKASERVPVRFIDDPELVYLMRRYREIHDYVHVLTGMHKPHVVHELAVKYFEFAQTHLPFTALAGLGGSFLAPDMTRVERRVLMRHLLPWAFRAGNRAELMMNVYFEELLDKDCNEIRAMLNLERAPDVDALVRQEEQRMRSESGLCSLMPF